MVTTSNGFPPLLLVQTVAYTADNVLNKPIKEISSWVGVDRLSDRYVFGETTLDVFPATYLISIYTKRYSNAFDSSTLDGIIKIYKYKYSGAPGLQ